MNHHRIETFGISFVMLAVLILSNVGTIFYRIMKYDTDVFNTKAIYTQNFSSSITGTTGKVLSVYRNPGNTKCAIVLYIDNILRMSLDANDYLMYYTGYNVSKNRYAKVNLNNPAGAFYVFGTTGYAMVLLVENNGFESQAAEINIGNTDVTGVADKDGSIYAKQDMFRIVVNPGASGVKIVDYLDENTDAVRLYRNVVIEQKEAEQRKILADDVKELNNYLVKIDRARKTLNDIGIVVPEISEQIRGDVVYLRSDQANNEEQTVPVDETSAEPEQDAAVSEQGNETEGTSTEEVLTEDAENSGDSSVESSDMSDVYIDTSGMDLVNANAYMVASATDINPVVPADGALISSEEISNSDVLDDLLNEGAEGTVSEEASGDVVSDPAEGEIPVDPVSGSSEALPSDAGVVPDLPVEESMPENTEISDTVPEDVPAELPEGDAQTENVISDEASEEIPEEMSVSDLSLLSEPEINEKGQAIVKNNNGQNVGTYTVSELKDFGYVDFTTDGDFIYSPEYTFQNGVDFTWYGHTLVNGADFLTPFEESTGKNAYGFLTGLRANTQGIVFDRLSERGDWRLENGVEIFSSDYSNAHLAEVSSYADAIKSYVDAYNGYIDLKYKYQTKDLVDYLSIQYDMRESSGVFSSAYDNMQVW